MEGGPLLEDWWVEAAKGFIPYVNIEAKFDGAPDQGMLRTKGGRGFPYCTIMNADGEVIWEVRPTSKEAIDEGFAQAKMLQSMKDKLAENADDAALSASVQLLAALGMGQRQAPPLEKLQELAKTPGVDVKIKEKFDAFAKMQAFEDQWNKWSRSVSSREEMQTKCLEEYRKGTRAPAGSRYEFALVYFAASAAVNAKAEDAAKICDEAEKLAKDSKRFKDLVKTLRDKLPE